MALSPVSLSGAFVDLVPLAPEQCDALIAAVSDGDIWKLWYTGVPKPATMAHEIEHRLSLLNGGESIPFAIRDKASGRFVGMTSYLCVDLKVPRVEIGSTWYAKSAQRTPINTEAKYLLLHHAFGEMGCAAVELRTHFLNHASRRAIERLGAKLDGVLRGHVRMQDGTLRDSCVYSIIASEWPAVQSHLQWQLQKPR